VSPDLTSAVVAVFAIGLVGLLLVCLAIALHPAPVEPAPAPADDVDPELTREVPPAWVVEARDLAQRRRAAADRVAAAFPPPAVRATVPFIAAGRAGLVERERATVALPVGRSR